ncbi:unnamed protein product [Brassica rapa]|uniref:Berberine/berberine-like domain-containing protein n=1 Tax=Brassica campestris TaxID=3711 RepID=A0A8D9HPV4_BRACM|nr:unnamed protein product [Brassica rapa]
MTFLHVNSTTHVLLVLAYKIKLVEVPETVTVFRVTRTLEQNVTEVVHRWQLTRTAPLKLPEEIFIRTTMEVLLERNETLMYIKRKSDYVLEPISRTGLESIWRKMIELETPTAIAFNPYGGMMAKISSTATPFPYRAGNLCKIQYDTDWGEDSLTKRSYVEGKRYGEIYFAGNFERLVEIKTRVDSGNFFRNENSIPVKPYFNS